MWCQDPASGLRAIIAIWSTRLGPALGGTRFYPYPDDQLALADALRLSRAMAYKAAVAGLDLGGGKAVILGDPARDRSEALLRAYGRFVASLGGRYWTACDVGTQVADMDVIAEECRFVTGRSPERGGAGDSAILTAFGVFQALRAAAAHRWGTAELTGRRVAVEGVGKVGGRLVDHLIEAGAEVVVSDANPAPLQALERRHRQVRIRPVAELAAEPVDVYAPCALGGTLTATAVAELRAEVVCGAANNQLADPAVDRLLAERGVLYVPDYVANAGGLIQVDDERSGFRFERAHAATARIYDTTRTVLERAARDGLPTGAAADQLAEDRMAAHPAHPLLLPVLPDR